MPEPGAAIGQLHGQGHRGKLARAVYLTGVDGIFGDNYFDLLPGETVAVPFKPWAAPATRQSIQATIRATTIADTYP